MGEKHVDLRKIDGPVSTEKLIALFRGVPDGQPDKLRRYCLPFDWMFHNIVDDTGSAAGAAYAKHHFLEWSVTLPGLRFKIMKPTRISVQSLLNRV